MRVSNKIVSFGIGSLCFIAFLSLIWPIYRISLSTMIGRNEAWNAFYADAAMGKMSLYPSLDKLITNNYPPLSFYFVGGIGKLVGDNILAGRIVSFLALMIIALFIGGIIKKLNGSQQARIVGIAYFIATIGFFFRWYVGMNDPQLLAQAIMIGGLLLFLKAASCDRDYWLPMFVMVVAGFFKHNIVTIPFAALIWLAFQRRWKPLIFCSCFAMGLIVVGLFFCYWAYGADFFSNMLMPRRYLFAKVVDEMIDLRAVIVSLVAWFLISWNFRREPQILFVSLLVFTGFIVGFSQRLGSGVFLNAQLDLVIASAVAVGMTFSLLEKQMKRVLFQTGLLIAILIPLLTAPNFYELRLSLTPAFQKNIAAREQLMAQEVAEVRAMPGDALCEACVVYRAGKPFIVDIFSVGERMLTGKLPRDTIARRLNDHTLTRPTQEASPYLESPFSRVKCNTAF